ncbi:MAG: hypothetical protein KC609_12865 [Myxococcales bacterium]|nr:hypothetical protein [Myxococcales bacterium]
MEFLTIINRFFHILSAIIGVGGLFVLWRLVFPALELLEQDQQETVVVGFSKIWRIVLWHAFALLLVTGAIGAIIGWKSSVTWQMLFGIKMLLAVVVTGLGVYLTLPGLSAGDQLERRKLYPIAVLVGFGVVAAGAVLRFQS